MSSSTSEPTPDVPTAGTPVTPEQAEGPEPVQEPSDITLLVDPTRVRRAPKYKAFFTVGALVGIVGGLWFGLWLAGNVDPLRGDFPLQKPGVYVTVIVAVTTMVTVLLAGLAAIIADRRSLRKR